MSPYWATIWFLVAVGFLLVIAAGVAPSSVALNLWQFRVEIKNPFRHGLLQYQRPTYLLGFVMLAISVVLAVSAVVQAAFFGSSGQALDGPPPGPEAEFLGKGFANVEGPARIFPGRSGIVLLIVSLSESLEAKDVVWKATAAGQPAEKASVAGQAGVQTILQDARLEDVPIYSRMRARLDAPTFDYLETDWVSKQVREATSWEWIISPRPGYFGVQQAFVTFTGPEGIGARKVLLEIEVPDPDLIQSEPAAAPIDGGPDSLLFLALVVAVSVVAGFAYWAMRRRLRR